MCLWRRCFNCFWITSWSWKLCHCRNESKSSLHFRICCKKIERGRQRLWWYLLLLWQYGSYLAWLDRGGLNVPQDSTCQWAIFSYIIFDVIKTSICRRSVTSVFQQVSDAYNLHRENSHCVALANILFNNFCKASTSLIRKEVNQKVIKLP